MVDFYRDAMLSAVAVVVCLSICVCVSVTFRYCVKTAKRRTQNHANNVTRQGFQVRCFVVAGFLLTSASYGPSVISELLVNFGAPSISQEWLKLELSNFVHIKSCQRDHRPPLKGRGFANVTHFCIRNCGLRKNSPLHSMKCDKQCHRRWTTDYRTYGARGHPP